MDKIKIIPIFVPHVGCPNDCVFCNQRKITGKTNIEVRGEYVQSIVEKYIKTIENTYTEIAFFGGSFTAIDLELQTELLKVAKYYKDLGIVHSIRCSTRPDAINDEILQLQKHYGMDIIELGIQSLDDEVLKLSNRGHTREDSLYASALIKKYGFVLGHQIMPGLPGSTRDKDIQTCIDSIALKPDIVRIYPTLIIKDTELCYMYEKGIYKPLTLMEAVDRSAYIYSLYRLNNIKVIRIGLQNSDTINEGEDVVAGPFHPAFRQLVEEKLYLNTLIYKLKGMELRNKNIVITAKDNLISYISGQKKANIIKLKEIFGIKQIVFKNTKKDIIEISHQNKVLCSFEQNEIFQNYLKMQGDLCI
ncbi:MAG TPA: radical SAM protein [Tissierellia bacterium]|nr:radical SAM protein [Tissierellia bacterium]